METSLLDHYVPETQISSQRSPVPTSLEGRSHGAPSDGLVGRSTALRTVRERIKLVGRTDTTVLIQGETGTGKELVARGIHEASSRRGEPFVAINVAAIARSLLESELFGHERGAFTGALARRVGHFERAEGGTIFLDEIGELDLELQPKLLRLLQEREIQRVGSSKPFGCNVRLVAATNRDLRTLVDAGTFRADLFYRLNVFRIHTPPLRERVEDIRPLVAHFTADLARKLGRSPVTASALAIAELERYPWPGNIRELQNVIERSLIVSTGSELSLELDELAPATTTSRQPASAELCEVERAHISRVLEDCHWVVAGPHGAAARLGLKRSTLNHRLKKLGIVRGRAHRR